MNGANAVYLVATNGTGILSRLTTPPGDTIDWIGAVGADPSIQVTELAGGTIQLTWRARFSNYRLESTTDLAQPQWQPRGPAGVNSVAVSVDPGSRGRFFRLAKP